MRLEIKPT